MWGNMTTAENRSAMSLHSSGPTCAFSSAWKAAFVPISRSSKLTHLLFFPEWQC